MTSGISVNQIAAVAPTVGGGLWRAPLGSTLPTDQSTALDAAFVSLGYVDEDGVTMRVDRPSNPVFAWGGDKVATVQQHWNVTFVFKLMQPLDPDVLKAVHSDTNTTVTPPTSTMGTLTKTSLNSKLNLNSAWVIQGFYQLAGLRIVVPIARISALADTQLTHKALTQYNCTLEAFPDSLGNSAYQYFNDGIHT